MQDGIGTERVPASYAEAIDRLFAARGCAAPGPGSRGFGAPIPRIRWDSLHERVRDLKGSREVDDRLWENYGERPTRSGGRLRSRIPCSKAGRWLLSAGASMFSHQLTQYYGSCARAGGGVFVLDQPGRSMACRNLVAGAFPPGSFQHLDLSPPRIGCSLPIALFRARPKTVISAWTGSITSTKWPRTARA